MVGGREGTDVFMGGRGGEFGSWGSYAKLFM